MSFFPTFGVPSSAVGTDILSRDIFECDFAYLDWSADSNQYVALSGHTASFARGATLAGVVDANGNTYTALEAQLGWEYRDWDRDSAREAIGIRMDTSDTLGFSNSMLPMWHHGLLEMIELGARTMAAGTTIFSHRNDAATGAGFWIDTSGSGYRMNYSDGSTTRTATLSANTSATGDCLVFGWEISALGALTFSLTINSGAPIVATAAALTLPATWAASSSTRFNSNGTGSKAKGWYRRARMRAGTFDLTALMARR